MRMKTPEERLRTVCKRLGIANERDAKEVREKGEPRKLI